MTSARYHLLKYHDIELEPDDRRVKDTSDKRLQDIHNKVGIQQKELENEIFKKILNKKVINEALVSLIVL